MSLYCFKPQSLWLVQQQKKINIPSTREMQSKNMMRYHQSLIRIAKVKKTDYQILAKMPKNYIFQKLLGGCKTVQATFSKQ